VLARDRAHDGRNLAPRLGDRGAHLRDLRQYAAHEVLKRVERLMDLVAMQARPSVVYREEMRQPAREPTEVGL